MTLFTDSEFFPENISLPDYFQNEDVKWLRPSEICREPKFLSNSYSENPFKHRHEVIKGYNGGFFLAAVAGLTGYPDRFDKVVCPWQILDWSGRKVIDDRLPTIEGKLIFAQAPGDFFWCALLEKAYAKFIGGYSRLNLGGIPLCLFHLTGQKSFNFLTKSLLPSAIYRHISEHCSQNQIICCKHKHYNGNNLEYGASYTVTGIRMTDSDHLITVRDVTLNEETTMKISEFKEEYDMVFMTVANEKRAIRMAKRLGGLIFGVIWDIFGRDIGTSQLQPDRPFS